MKADRWKEIDELFDAVLDLPEHQRDAFLLTKCVEDEDLRQEVLSLLKGETSANEFLEDSALNLMARELANDRSEIFSLIGRQIGTYKIEKPIGSGGMGEVYLAHDDKLNRKVALKILPAEFIADPERVKRFEREARMISTLNHPYIVTIYDVGRSDGLNYIATEFVEGETVRELINRGVDLKKTLSIISQTCEALAAAHQVGMIHRDIKPENIMIRPDGFVKVLDFGLAKLGDQTEIPHSLSNYTMKGTLIGTPAYMSPEQASGGRVDHRTDLWSVGVVLYEMLTSRNPFKGDSRQATFQKILSENPPYFSELDEDAPAEMDSILSKALEKDADLSYQSASDLLADLKRVRRSIDSSPSLRSRGSTETGDPAGSRRPSFFVLAAGAMILISIAVGIWFFAFRQLQSIGTDWSMATNVQLTSEKGTEYFPALSPDGKSFVYASDAGGKFDIFIQRVGGKNPTNLTKDSPLDDTQPAFSPDGEKIAFRSEREPKGIYMIGASGENISRIADFGYHPSWSPDGKEIVVSTFGRDQPTVRSGGDHALSVINIETGAVRLLINADASFPAWSPAGKRVAYWFYAGPFGRRDIATVPAAGGEPVAVAKDFAVSNWNPVWSPDGKFLYFVSNKSGSLNFWRVRIDESSGAVLSEPEPVVTPSKFSRHMNFSRDGKRMIYVQTNSQSNIQGVDFDERAGKVIGSPYWITQGDREISRAELSPDGTRFVMRLIRTTQDDIVTVSRDGREWRDVTNDAPFDRYVRWSPDGKQLAFHSDRNGGNVWMCNADGTNLHQVTFPTPDITGFGFPIWSPDGKSLSYTIDGQTFIMDLSKSWDEQPQQRLPLSGNVTTFTTWDWSPDGKSLAGTVGEGEAKFLGIYSFETNTYKKLADGNEFISSWLPDSRHLVYGFENKIFMIDTNNTKTTELLANPTLQLRSPFVSRDGKLLYYVASTSESDIWLLNLSQNP